MKMYELLLFVPKDPINNILALVPKMPWRRPGGEPTKIAANVITFEM